MPTFCEDCEHVHPESRKRSPTSWLCMKFPRLEGMGFVAPKAWAKEEPYMRASGINGGACCVFKPRRTSQTENGL